MATTTTGSTKALKKLVSGAMLDSSLNRSSSDDTNGGRSMVVASPIGRAVGGRCTVSVVTWRVSGQMARHAVFKLIFFIVFIRFLIMHSNIQTCLAGRKYVFHHRRSTHSALRKHCDQRIRCRRPVQTAPIAARYFIALTKHA